MNGKLITVVKFFRIILFLFVLVPLYIFLSLSVLMLPGLIAMFIISAITGDSAGNIFGTIVGVMVSGLFYFKTNFGKRIICYVGELSDKFANFVE